MNLANIQEARGAIKMGRAVVAELREKAASKAIVNDTLMSVSDALTVYASALEVEIDRVESGLP